MCLCVCECEIEDAGAQGDLRVAGVVSAHVAAGPGAVAALPAAQGAHARADSQESALDEPHLERQGRRQRHPAQQLQVRQSINQSINRFIEKW